MTLATNTRRRLLRGAAAAAALAAGGAFMQPALAQADAYPSKPITIIVPVPPGGATDALTRKVGEKLQALLGQTVIVESRAGAGGTIAAGYVANAAPDGYTLLMGFTGSSAISASLYDKLPFDHRTAFAPISLIVKAPLVLMPRTGLKTASFAEYMQLAKTATQGVSYASAGNGSTMHLAGAMLAKESGANLLHIPYKGSGPALHNLMGGQVDSMFADLMQVLPMIRAGQLKALAVTSPERHPLLKDVPTVAESGFAGYEAISWHALFAPAGTPPAVVDTLYAAVAKALKSPDMQQHFESLGLLIEARTPADTRKFVDSEITKWAAIVKSTGAAQR